MSFEKLGIIKPIVEAIAQMGIIEPTPVQERAIPEALAKKDIFATAQTGTGKTAAFSLPMIQRIKRGEDEKILTRGVVISPTRELALQIAEDITNYAKNLPLQCVVLVGGKDYKVQTRAIQRGADVIVATPGRLDEHIKRGLKLDNVEFFVVDEADRMLDMGFAKEIRNVHEHLPKRHQTMLFCATTNDKVRKISKLLLVKPVFIETAKKNSTVENINQIAYKVDKEKKAALLAYLIGSRNMQQVLVFTQTKVSADALESELKKDALKCAVIHGDKTQAVRTKNWNRFKNGEVRVLIATDIASRGLDIEELPYVINYELPLVHEDYIHRVGRTGRAGRDGIAISLLDVHERQDIKAIEKLIDMKLEQDIVAGFEPDPTIKRKEVETVKLKNEYSKAQKREKTKRSFVKAKKEKVLGKKGDKKSKK
ncbi:MAG: DEAD/DEAH box helicase [Epsilonproteobacteria bacterium]|nr:DEAD/DEAH box helicase [Campylobacterota bacterium]